MASESIEQMLPEELRGHYTAIVREIQPLVDDESYTQAIARVDLILRGIPIDQENRLLRAAFLAKRGELRLDDEQYEEAEEDIRHALHNGLRHPAVWALAGWAYFYMDRPEKALEYFDQVLEEQPDETSALMGRALVLLELDELDKARADLTHALHCDASSARLHAMRGEVYVRLGELDKAERDIRQAVALDPRDQDYAVSLGQLLAVSGQPAEALEVVEQALSREEEPGLDALLLRSHLRLLNGELASARADAMSASNRFPDESFAFVQLAHVQLAEGNGALSLKAAERAVKLDPSLPDAYLVRGAARRLNGDEGGSVEDFQRASQAPAEMPMFLFGVAYEATDGDTFDADILRLIQPEEPEVDEAAGANPFAGMPFGGMPGMPGMGGMDPMRMMSQMFDDEGNIRGPFKPLVKMALRNAPSILKNMPPSMLKNMGGLDPSILEQVDLDNISPEDLEAQMKEFAKLMKSGQDPRDMMRDAQRELDRQKKKGD